MEENYINSPRNIDLEKICLNPSFGDLKFEQILPILKRMKLEIIELEDLDYKNYLTRNEINQIENIKKNYSTYIQQISSFNLNQTNPQQIRDGIQSQVNGFYEGPFIQQIRNPLIYLRQMLKINNSDEKEFQILIKNVRKIEEELKKKLENIKKDEASVERKEGILSGQYLSQVFSKQAESAEERSKFWSGIVIALSGILTITILGLIWHCLNGKIETIETKTGYALLSALLVAAIFYLLRFSIKQFNISHHIGQSNRHRASVAETLESFLVAGGSDISIKEALLKEAAAAMFRPESTGFLTKDQIDMSSPVTEMVNNFINDKK